MLPEENVKIVAARITEMPKDMFDPMPEVWVKTEGSTYEEKLFTYYPDEISFQAEEFIGLTKPDAYALFQQRDSDYLRS